MNGKFRSIRLGVIIGILLLTVFITMVKVPDNVVGPTVLPIATIGLDQSFQTAEVHPGALGTVEFTGTVSCVLNSATSAIVSLSATDTWNSATITPSALPFSNDDPGQKTFRVSVKAPLYTSRNIVGKVTVTGQVVMYPTTLYGTVSPSDGVEGRIDIQPFYKFQLSAPKKYQEVGPGQSMVYNIRIKNQGNIRDTFEIDVKNEKELTKDGFVITLSDRRVDVDEIQETEIKLTVNTPVEWNIWKNKVTGIQVSVVSVVSRDETGDDIEQLEFFKVRERGFSTPGFDPILLIIAFVGIAVIVKTRTSKRSTSISRRLK